MEDSTLNSATKGQGGANKAKPFLDENFLLKNKTAEILYNEYSKSMPIIYYH